MTDFTQAEMTELTRLLNKVAANGGYWPDETTMRAAHGVVSVWAPELVITRLNQRGETEILLAMYEGGAEFFNGLWHIPGGYNRWPEKDVQETCSRVAMREIGVNVRYTRTMDVYKWQTGEHPYGHPLSVYASCRPAGKITESGKLRFFPKNDTPENLVVPHRRFIQNYL